MPGRRLLLLDATGLSVYRWQVAGPEFRQRYTADDEGFASFREELRRHSRDLYYLLADVAEEGFQVEDIPHVQGSDRQELIKRKLTQFFYGSPLSLAISRGRLKEGRRDERLLCMGFTGPKLFEPWLHALQDCESRLVGLYSVPQVIAALMSKMGQQGNFLVMSLSQAGVRQTFFEQGQLRFSRLTATHTDSHADPVATSAAEMRKTLQYLVTQRLVPRDQALRTLIFTVPGQFDAFRAACPDTAEQTIELIDWTGLAQGLGLAVTPPGGMANAQQHGRIGHDGPVDARIDELLLHLLVQLKPRVQFAPAANRHFFFIWLLQSALRNAAVVVLACAGLLAGWQLYTLFNLDAANDLKRTEIEQGKRRYEALMNSLPKIPLSTGQLRNLTDQETLLHQRIPGMEPLLKHLAKTLDSMPAVELVKLEWHLSNTSNGDNIVSNPGTANPPNLTNSANATGGKAPESYAVLEISAQLATGRTPDHRGHLATVEDLVAALTVDQFKARVISLPFETESGKALRSDDNPARIEAAKFQIRLVQII